jgi:flagellar hook-associated protein 1 FlgK
LEDQRQLDLTQLSQLVGINQITTENNGISITTASGETLVSEGSNYPISTGSVDGLTHFFAGTTDITSSLKSGGGQIGGYLTVRDDDIPQTFSSLDQLAYSISTRVNALNNTGSDLSGATGTSGAPLYIFSQPTTVAGSALAMSVVINDPSEIAAGVDGEGSGDNSNAILISSLATQGIVDGQAPSSFYSNFVTALGATVSGVQAENAGQNASVTQLQTLNDALSSVNLNDEASMMQQMERSYQAASQVFTILNTLITSALNLGTETAVS